MKRIFTTLRPPIEQKSYVDWISKCSQKVSVSSRGLVAFTSSFCLNQARPISSSYHVYVADLNTPYQPYLLVDSEYEFTIVEWDPSGSKLLVCDVTGSATIYNSKDYLISDWKPYFKQVFAAESFIAAIWYHQGLVSTINVVNQSIKSPSNHLEYSDKINQSKYGASLRLFGGKPAEGCLFISNTGLICCLTLIADGTVDVVSESLSPLRARIEIADICHSKDGSFVVSTSAGSINSTISFYQINLSTRNITLDEVDLCSGSEGRRIFVKCTQFNSFHLNIMSQILNERGNSTTFDRVAQIKFVSKDSPDDVLVEVSGNNLSLVELWELEIKKKAPVHGAILDIVSGKGDVKPNTNNVGVKHEENGNNLEESTKEWSFKGNYINDKDLISIQTPRFKLFGNNRQLNVILLAYNDSTVCCLRKEDLQPIDDPIDLSTWQRNGKLDNDNSPYKIYQRNGSYNGNSSKNSVGSNNYKTSGIKGRCNGRQQCQPIYITDMQLTSNQAAFIAIDNLSQLYAVKLPPLIGCQDEKDHENYLQYILEYCLITGNDWWDAIVCARSESIESLCDKFQDAYERQPKHIQRKYYNRQLMIRASLHRCLNSPSNMCKSSDYHTMIMLNSIASTMKSMLRSHDQDSPSENLSNFLRSQGANPSFYVCNNVISKINEKEFYIESNLIQCLQPLSQWVVDLAIFLIASTPQRIMSGTNHPGSGLAQSREALETLRELLVIIKIWGMQNSSSSPVVHKLNDSIDVIGSLFRLISTIYNQLCNNNGASTGNQTGEQQQQQEINHLIDGCVQLTNCVSVSQFAFLLAPIGVASPLYHSPNASGQLHQLPAPHQRATNNETSNHLVLEYFKEPRAPEQVTLPQVETAINMNGKRQIDVVRNISLGAFPVSNLRHCTRCRAVSLIKPSFNTNRIWEQRWISSCVCGGSWAQSDGTFVNKAGYLAWLHHNSAVSSLNHAHQLVVR